MQGKTHAAAAVAAALLITRPTTPLILGATVAAAALGGLAPDVDALYSDARKFMNNATAAICLVLIAGLLLAQNEVVQLSSLISAGRTVLTGDLFFGPALLICFLIVGGMMPHRSMTHSIAAVLVVWQCLVLIPEIGTPFVLGYISHLLLDLLNRKGLQLFFPFPQKVCLGFCSSERLVNRIMFLTSEAFAILYVSFFLIDTIVPGFHFL